MLLYYYNIGAASGAGDREEGFFMYKAIDFPSPLLLFLALFRSLSLSCSLLLSRSLSGGGGGFGPLSRSGFEFSPSAFAKKGQYLDYLPTLCLKRCVFAWDVLTLLTKKMRTSHAKTHLLRQSVGR